MQSHTMDAIASQLDLPTGQLLAMFNKTVRKVSLYLKRVEENEAKEELNKMNNEGTKKQHIYYFAQNQDNMVIKKI